MLRKILHVLPVVLCLFFFLNQHLYGFEVNPGSDREVFENATTTLGGSPTAWDGKEPYSYEWTLEDGTAFSEEANPMIDIVLGNTNYFLEVTDANGISCSELVVVTGVANPQNIKLKEITFSTEHPIR